MPTALVVGAGIIGLCSAEALLAAGYEVTVIDRAPEQELDEGCSTGNGGIIVPSHFTPLAAPGMIRLGLKMLRDGRSPFGIEGPISFELASWVARFALSTTRSHVERSAPLLARLNLASRDAYVELIDKMGAEVGFERRGLLMLCNTRRALNSEHELVRAATTYGLKAQAITSADVQTMEPSIQTDVEGGVYFEDDAHLSPSLLMRELNSYLRSHGVKFVLGSGVQNIYGSGGKAEGVLTAQGSIEADAFVFATGAWSAELQRALGSRIPVVGGRGYGFTVPHPPEAPTRPAILVEARVAVTPMPTGLRFVGALILGSPNSKPDARRLEGIRRSIPKFYPAFGGCDLQSLPTWTGVRPCCPDGLPMIGITDRWQNVAIATGHAMMGMSLGPITGRLVAQALCGQEPEVPLHLVRPNRFGSVG